MSTTTSDLVEHAATKEENGILSATRGFMVDGIEGDPTAIGYIALQADGIPVYGAFHPTIPNIRATDRVPLIHSPSQATVLVTYKPWRLKDQRPTPGSPPQIDIGASSQEVETNFDSSGDQITLTHTFKKKDASGNIKETTVIQGGTVKVQIPQVVMRFTRQEFILPIELIRFYVGRVDSGGFLGDAPRSWLCTRIESASDDGGITWKVTYEFQKAYTSWDATVVFIDPETGEPPEGLVEGLGKKDIRIYQEADFGALGLAI